MLGFAVGTPSPGWAASSCTPPQPNTDILWCWGKAPAHLVGREALRDTCRKLCLQGCPGTDEEAQRSRLSPGAGPARCPLDGCLSPPQCVAATWPSRAFSSRTKSTSAPTTTSSSMGPAVTVVGTSSLERSSPPWGGPTTPSASSAAPAGELKRSPRVLSPLQNPCAALGCAPGRGLLVSTAQHRSRHLLCVFVVETLGRQ